MAGAQRRCVTLRPPDYCVRGRRARAPRSRRGRARCCSTRRTTRPARCSPAPSSTPIAALCVEHDLIAVTDEVYEHLVYDGVEHIPLATLPGMRDRTVTISSAGKTFSMTGWKTGWICASADARRRGAHGEAVPHLRPRRAVPARGRGRPAPPRRVLHRPRRRAGGEARPAGGRPDGRRASTCSRRRAPTSSRPTSGPWARPTGSRSAGALPERCGVVAVPTVVFYDDVAAGAPLVRFTFCKRREVLEDAVHGCRRCVRPGVRGRA